MDDQETPAAYTQPVLTAFGRVTQFTHGSKGSGADGTGLKLPKPPKP